MANYIGPICVLEAGRSGGFMGPRGYAALKFYGIREIDMLSSMVDTALNWSTNDIRLVLYSDLFFFKSPLDSLAKTQGAKTKHTPEGVLLPLRSYVPDGQKRPLKGKQ